MPTYYRLPTPEEDPYHNLGCTVRPCSSTHAALLRRTSDGHIDGSAVCPEHTDRLGMEDHR